MTYPQTPGYVKGSDTSKAAADSIEQSVTHQRGRVFDYVGDCGDHGTTYTEGEQHLKIRPNAITGRLTELKHYDLIMDSGRRRLTSPGHMGQVYVLTNKGKTLYAKRRAAA